MEQRIDEEPYYLTAKEVAQRQRIHPDTVRTALGNAQLRGHRVGSRGDWRIAIDDYRAWIARGAPTAQPKAEEAQP